MRREFDPADTDPSRLALTLKSIVVPRLTIKGTSISGSYDPVPGVQDTITVKARFAGGAIRGTFTEGPTCVGAGRFIARPGS